MDLMAFAVAIIVILAVLFILGIALIVAENRLERKLFDRGYPTDYMKRPIKSMFKKREASAPEAAEPAAETAPEKALPEEEIDKILRDAVTEDALEEEKEEAVAAEKATSDSAKNNYKARRRVGKRKRGR